MNSSAQNEAHRAGIHEGELHEVVPAEPLDNSDDQSGGILARPLRRCAERTAGGLFGGCDGGADLDASGLRATLVVVAAAVRGAAGALYWSAAAA